MAHIDYYFSTLSPFAYLAGLRMEAAAQAHGASVTYKPLDIMALFARTGGTAPKDRHPNRMAFRNQDLQRQAKKLDMPLNLKPAHWPTNPAPSSYAIIAAQASGADGDLPGLVHGFLRAVWAEEKDIAEDAVVKQCLEQAGYDPDLSNRGLLAGAETYAKNLEDAVEAGAFGAPFYAVDTGQVFWGNDRIDDLALHLDGKL